MLSLLKRILHIKTAIEQSQAVVYYNKEKYLVYTKKNIIELSDRDTKFIINTYNT